MTKKPHTNIKVANIAPFGLRMQPDLKQRVEESASANQRSLNAEIVYRLDRSLTEDDLVIIDEGAPPPADPREHATRLAATFVYALRFGLKNRSFKDPDDLKIFIADLLDNYNLPLEAPSSEGSALINLGPDLASRLESEAAQTGRRFNDIVVARLESSFRKPDDVVTMTHRELEQVIHKVVKDLGGPDFEAKQRKD